ncbi:MAG: hypothetical protein WCD75_22060, partial [Rhodoplanes sp.]
GDRDSPKGSNHRPSLLLRDTASLRKENHGFFRGEMRAEAWVLPRIEREFCGAMAYREAGSRHDERALNSTRGPRG